MTILSDQMELGVRLARFGDREQARMVFSAIVEYRPAEVDAWLWLSEMADSLDDQVTALEKAVQYFSTNGENSQNLQDRLNSIRGGLALSAPETIIKTVQEKEHCTEKHHPTHNEIYQKAERYFLLGANDKAFQLLAGLLEEDPTHEDALMLISELVPEPERKAALLEKVIELNPQNEEAARRLRSLPLAHGPRCETRPRGLLNSLTRRLFAR